LKVAYVFSKFEACGPNNVTMNIIKHLGSKYEVSAISLSGNDQDSFSEELRRLNVSVHEINLSKWEGLLKAGGHLKTLIEEIKPDVVHSYGIRADMITAKHLKSCRTMSTLHCDTYLDYSSTYNKWLGRIMDRMHISSLRKFNKSLTVSKSVADGIEKRHGFNIDYIQNGIDVELFKNAGAKEKVELRRKLKLPLDKKIFLSIGVLSNRKNPFPIIETFKKAGLKDCHMIFLGDGHLAPGLRKEIGNKADICLLGNVANVNEYLKAADFVISTSLAEGLPNSILEGLACGLPAVLSDIPSHKELLAPDPSAGVLCDCQDSNSIYQAIETIMNKDYSHISKRARKLVLDHYCAEKMSQKYQQAYDALTAKAN